ncbi:DUF4913 domain-containing protein [Nocardia neocaledoniensis]|uniref:DUF4913 domain-containing protein n=1 Tax=Nocardia neocaledoniensis TaxID=236511 RepID=UPI0024549DA0|nr:DUF4913 domain-containing protein [Nocardia neocaledoniensis]
MTTTETTTENAEATAETAAIGGVDLTESMSAAVRKAVNAQVTAAAKEIAQGAINDFLTEDVVATMRETALLEAEAAVNPDAAAAVAAADAAPEPEPEPEQAPEPEEAPRRLHHERLDLFVEKYLAHSYRREVTRTGIESTRRWCPQWWDHSEAFGRLEALWMAWEQARLGEGAEMAAWWTQFADPMMAALFDPEGVFKYCSVADGHKDTLKRLPSTPAPKGWFVDGHAHDGPEPGMTASGLYLPPPSTGRGRVVVAIDEFGE